VESDGFAVSAFWRVRPEGLTRVCRVLLAEIRTNCLRVWAGPLLCAFLWLRPSGSGIKRVAGAGEGERTCAEDRGGTCLSVPERCRAPQWGKTPLHRAAERGLAAVVEQLVAAGAVMDAHDEILHVREEGGRR